MAPKVFLTGGTGYIGGSVLHTIATAHPEYSITVLLRKTPPTFTSCYPNITILQGDYDSFSTIETAASAADIVIHNGNSDHEASLSAILSGLKKRSSPGYLLHLSGTGIVSDWATDTHLGRLNPKIWSDVTSLNEIRNLPDGELHRNTEIMLHAAAASHSDKLNIAIMCPPDIYGPGHGLAKKQSALIPSFVKEIENLGGQPFYYKDGSNTRSWVHIDDLMTLYLNVVEAAASGNGGGFGWNAEGYYFASTQEHSQLDVARATGEILHRLGKIESPEPVEVGLEKLDGMANLPGFPKLARYLFASNSRTRAERAGTLFGYKGAAPGLLESLEADIRAAVDGQ